MTDVLPDPLPLVRESVFDPAVGLVDHRPIRRMSYPDGTVGWLVTGYALAQRVLTDRRFSARMESVSSPVRAERSDPAPPGMFLYLDGEEHARYRRLVTGQFTVRRTNRLAERIEQVVAEALDRMASLGAPVDLVREFALPVPSLVICELLGVPYDDHDLFQHWTATTMNTGSTSEEVAAAEGELTDYLGVLIARKRVEPTDDLMGGLAAAGELTDEEILGIAHLLLVAGHETTANMLAFGTFALLRHPEQAARLRRDPALVDGAVEELLRYLSIGQYDLGGRMALADLELDGHLVRAGEVVTVSIPAVNRDPERFAEPDTFDITRTATRNLAFGHGVHACLGQHLARTELRVAFPALLDRFPGLRLAVPADEVPMRHDMPVYGVYALPVAW